MLLLPLLFYVSCCFQEDDDRALANIRHRLARTGLLNTVFLLSRKTNTWQTKLLLGLVCCQMSKTMRTHKGQNKATLPPSQQQKS